MLTTMQRDHLVAETKATAEGWPFQYARCGFKTANEFLFRGRADANAHVKAWREHKINVTLDYFINTYSLAARELAGGPL